MSATQIQNPGESGTVEPDSPSAGMPEASIDEELEPESGGYELQEYEDISGIDDEEYDANILHIADTHEEEPYDEIIDELGDEEIDLIVNTGDNYQLPGEVSNIEGPDGDYEPGDFDEEELEEYIEGYREHFEGIKTLADHFDAEAVDNYGNHDPVIGSHNSEDSDAFKEAVNSHAEEMLGGFEHENLRDYMLDSYEVQDFEGGVMDIGDVRIVGGLSNMDPEDAPEETEMPGIDELYSEEELEGIADEMSDDSGYGLLGSLPYIGRFFRMIDEVTDGEDEVDVGDIELEDIPDDMMNEAHAEYLEEDEEQFEEYNERREAIEPLIEEHDGPVLISGHQDMASESQYGSTVFADLAEEYDQVVGVMGGHTHSPGLADSEAVNINSAESFSQVGVRGEEVHVDHFQDQEEEREVGPEDQDAMIDQIAEGMIQRRSEEELRQDIEQIENNIESSEDEEEVEQGQRLVSKLKEGLGQS